MTALDYLAEYADGAGASLTELADGVGLPKPTLLRLLAPLREARLVELRAGRYRLGPQTVRLGRRYLERLELRTEAGELLRGLAGSTGETVHLAVPDPPWVVYVDKVESRHPVRMVSRIGARQPMHSTAVGKAYLGFAPESELDAVLAAGLARRTRFTITTESRLRAELHRVRRRGYAIDDEENETDIRCVAAPIFDHTDRAVAAVSVSGPGYRMVRDRTVEVAAEVVTAASGISERLGAGPTTEHDVDLTIRRDATHGLVDPLAAPADQFTATRGADK